MDEMVQRTTDDLGDEVLDLIAHRFTEQHFTLTDAEQATRQIIHSLEVRADDFADRGTS